MRDCCCHRQACSADVGCRGPNNVAGAIGSGCSTLLFVWPHQPCCNLPLDGKPHIPFGRAGRRHKSGSAATPQRCNLCLQGCIPPIQPPLSGFSYGLPQSVTLSTCRPSLAACLHGPHWRVWHFAPASRTVKVPSAGAAPTCCFALRVACICVSIVPAICAAFARCTAASVSLKRPGGSCATRSSSANTCTCEVKSDAAGWQWSNSMTQCLQGGVCAAAAVPHLPAQLRHCFCVCHSSRSHANAPRTLPCTAVVVVIEQRCRRR